MGQRPHRVSDTLKQAVAEIILEEVADPRLAPVTVTAAELSHDLSHLVVYFLTLGGEPEERDAQAGLDHARGFIRRRLASRVEMRHVPELEFRIDATLKQERHIDELLNRARESREADS